MNLSNYELTETQKTVLFKGLKFTPTPKTNTFELKSDIRNFSRKLRLIEFFATEQGGHEEEESIHQNKSSFCPPINRDKKLDAAINFINGLNLSQPESNKSNLSKKQWKGINDLKNNDSIIIKEADKGGCVVIMNKTHYKAMVYNQLDDRVTYKRTGKSCDKTVFNKLSKLVKKYQGDLTKKEIDYLTKFMFKTSNFYGLPKVHKSDIITKAIEEQNSEYIKISEPGDLTPRPIVAGPNCPTKRLSTFIDTIIKPLVLHIKSYIRDSIHFLQKCSRIANDRTVLCMFSIFNYSEYRKHGCLKISDFRHLSSEYQKLRFQKNPRFLIFTYSEYRKHGCLKILDFV